jgi:hypothetical protein
MTLNIIRNGKWILICHLSNFLNFKLDLYVLFWYLCIVHQSKPINQSITKSVKYLAYTPPSTIYNPLNREMANQAVR